MLFPIVLPTCDTIESQDMCFSFLEGFTGLVGPLLMVLITWIIDMGAHCTPNGA